VHFSLAQRIATALEDEMKRWLSVALLFLSSLACGAASAAPDEVLQLVRVIPLPATVGGRIDHFALDAAGERLYLAALGNNTLEVIDLRLARHAQSLKGFGEPSYNRIWCTEMS